MTTALYEHARANLACNYNPYIRQYYQIPRITLTGGSFNIFSSMFQYLNLPDSKYFYHLFEVNLGSLQIMGVDQVTKNNWVKLSDLYINNHVRYRLLDNTGKLMHLSLCYLYIKNNSTVFIAVPVIPVFNLNYDIFYLEIYRPDYYSLNNNKLISINSFFITGSADIMAANNAINDILSSNSYVSGLFYFKNGIKVDSLASLTTGDYCEIVYEPSVYKVIDYQINTLKSFNSVLDNTLKYILHYTGDSGIIDYVINIDMYIYDASTGISYVICQGTQNTLRMLTHKDYSINVSVLNTYIRLFTENTAFSNLHLRFHVHYPSVKFWADSYALRIDYLTALNDTGFYDAVFNGTVSEWQAANLEASAYTKFMRTLPGYLTQAMAENAYGYNEAICKLGYTPNPVIAGAAEIPVGYRNIATAFEYDFDGKLLGYYPVTAYASNYIPVNNTCVTVEYVEGSPSTILDEIYDLDTPTFQIGYNYKFYVKYSNNPNTDTNWHDVTNTGLFTMNDSTGSWDSSLDNYQTKRLIRSDRKFLCYTVNLTPVNGNYFHQINYMKISNGYTVSSGVSVPLLDYEFYLNGHLLVDGIDYIFNHPTFCLISNAYLLSSNNVLTVRATGFCGADMQPRKDDEAGFVFDGVISVNGKYGPWLDTINRIIVGGKLINNDTSIYAETSITKPLTNGLPYSIKRKVTPLLNLFTVNDPYTLYQNDRVLENKIISFINKYEIETQNSVARPINPITGKYPLYSPIITALITNIMNGVITETMLESVTCTNDVLMIISSYTYLINYEPSISGNYDPLYAVTLPTPSLSKLTLSKAAFNLLSICNSYYLNNVVDLNDYINISG